QHLRDALGKLGMSGEFELEVCRDARMGITGTRASVHLKQAPAHHRHLSDIRKIIESASYAPAITTLALDIFLKIAVAEARIHGTSIEAVHFHEVGATDSIVDIVAAAVCLDYLNVDHVYCKTLELGGGMVRCAHGLMPVPAPATAEILNGVPCRYDGVNQEATTPTGAAILKTVVKGFSAPAAFRSTRIGYGVGQKDFDVPNVLRVMLGELPEPATTTYESELNREIHCNIDDMPAEAFQPLVDRLLQAGAKDVYLTPIIMKKARPATKVSVLCAPELSETLQRILFTHSTTIGIRVHDVDKRMLPRREQTLTTSLGDVSVKIVSLPDGGRRWKLEYDDVARLATQSGEDYLTVHKRLAAEVAGELGD
ncbi:MAG: nickel pincer cofactor biosynthesis protein LarC, partial [Pseudomonadales bacterium]